MQRIKRTETLWVYGLRTFRKQKRLARFAFTGQFYIILHAANINQTDCTQIPFRMPYPKTSEVSRLRHFQSGSCPRNTETGAFFRKPFEKETNLKHDNSHKKRAKNRGVIKQCVSTELTHRNQCCTSHLQGKWDWQSTTPLSRPEKPKRQHKKLFCSSFSHGLKEEVNPTWNGQVKHKDYQDPCTWIVWASKRFQISPTYHGKSSISFTAQKRGIVEIFCSRHDSYCVASQTQNELKRITLAT